MKQSIFVKLDEYNEIMKTVGLLRSKLEDAKSTLEIIRELKHDEDSELELWNANLQEIEKKLLTINKTFSEPVQPGD